MSRKFILLCLLIGLTTSSNAQVIEDNTEALGVAVFIGPMLYGAGASFYDVNEDGWDDLTICIPGAPTRFYLNVLGQFQLHSSFDNIYDSKSCLWADYDEDGDNDLFIIHRDGPMQLFKQTDSLVFVQSSSLLNASFASADNSFGSAFGDLNRDSYLDLFVANYGTASTSGSKNRILTNLTNGNFSAAYYGYTRNSFQPTWIDLGNDGFQDLFIINDFRFGSEIFTKSAMGAFTDETLTTTTGLAPHIDEMSNSWCDFDNDADLDVYISNTPPTGNHLLSNDGSNVFTNVAPSVHAELHKWSWSALWLDIENDGWNDLFVNSRNLGVGLEALFGIHMLRNDNGIFTMDTVHGADDFSYGFFTSAKGDINNDGLYDIYFGAESSQISRVFLNTTSTTNNYAKLRLKGRLSNRNGIGTRIDYYVNGTHRVHYTQSGENYLCQNSQNFIFGLGAYDQIDSLQLKWQSGVVDTYYNISANALHVLTEAETRPVIVASKTMLCPTGNDSLQLSISGWPNHTWGDGSTADSILVTAAGVYSLTVGTGYGHTLQLNYDVQMASADDFTVTRLPPLCAGDSTGLIEISNAISGDLILSWNNLSAGNYIVPLTLFEGCVAQQEILIEEPFPFYLTVDSVANACFGLTNGSAVVLAFDGTAPYTGFSDSGALALTNLSSGVYADTVTDVNGCHSSYTFIITEIPKAIIEITSPNWVCAGESVAFEANVSGIGSNYFWDALSPGELLGAGSYVTAVIDSFQCATPVNVQIEEIPVPTITANISSESVLGLGSISLDVIGNYPPYAATWQSGFVGLNYTGLAQGNYYVSVSDSLGCIVDSMFTVLFDFVEEERSSNDFIVDWKTGQLKYIGTERLFGLEIYNDLGQLILTKSNLGTNESVHLNIASQTIYIASSKGKSRTKVMLR
jgi:hypothetical protein